MKYRSIAKIFPAIPTMEGAGVRLHRLLGFQSDNPLDPFLLLDDFSSKNRDDYIRGFPWHPHRGIETITYILQGHVEHQDSMGNKGTIGPGDVQWMTAGSGIIHQEMPQYSPEGLVGFQLWANLPQSQKMMHPRYRDVQNEIIPTYQTDEGIHIRIIAGKIQEIIGPVRDIVISPEYFDVQMPVNTEWIHVVPDDFTAFIYVFEGEIFCDPAIRRKIPAGNVVKFSSEGNIQIKTEDLRARFLFVSGRPLDEPIAWRGPIVMNTETELKVAFQEVQDGTFIKHKI